MANNTKPDDQGLPDQSAHPGLDWDSSRTKPSIGDDERNIKSNPSLVPLKSWADRQHPDIPDLFVAGGMRAPDDARVPRVEFLQCYSYCVLRLGYLRNCCYADL